MQSNGIIGRSGKFYECDINEHIPTAIQNKHDAPFAFIRTYWGNTNVQFEACYTEDKIKPTIEQFETLMDWCTEFSKKFEDVTACWDSPWSEWRSN